MGRAYRVHTGEGLEGLVGPHVHTAHGVGHPTPFHPPARVQRTHSREGWWPTPQYPPNPWMKALLLLIDKFKAWPGCLAWLPGLAWPGLTSHFVCRTLLTATDLRFQKRQAKHETP